MVDAKRAARDDLRVGPDREDSLAVLGPIAA
jgi:hypothetical protein